MPRTAIATNDDSGITQAEADSLGIYLLLMSFTMNKGEHREKIDIFQKEFYKIRMREH